MIDDRYPISDPEIIGKMADFLGRRARMDTRLHAFTFHVCAIGGLLVFSSVLRHRVELPTHNIGDSIYRALLLCAPLMAVMRNGLLFRWYEMHFTYFNVYDLAWCPNTQQATAGLSRAELLITRVWSVYYWCRMDSRLSGFEAAKQLLSKVMLISG